MNKKQQKLKNNLHNRHCFRYP